MPDEDSGVPSTERERKDRAEAKRYRFYVDADDTLGRKLVLDEEDGLLGLGQILRAKEWVYCFLDPHSYSEIDEADARGRAGGASLNAPASGPSGDHEFDRDVHKWGEPGAGSGKAIAGDIRDIEATAKRAGRELTADEALECAEKLRTLRANYELAWEFSRGTPTPVVEVEEDAGRPKVRLAQTHGDWLKIGGTVEGALALAESEGRVEPGTAAEFKRKGMPPPFGEAPMVEYRDMLRHLLATAAAYVEIEDGYPEGDEPPPGQ